MSKSTFTIGVFAAILDEKNRILFCHRTDHDLWNLPGGALEYSETPWDCAIRETKEETGLDIKVKRLAGVYSKPDKNEVVFQFICEIVGGKITLNKEADKIEYFAFNDIPKNTPPKQVERIKDVLVGKGETLVMKIQEGPSSIDLIKSGRL